MKTAPGKKGVKLKTIESAESESNTFRRSSSSAVVLPLVDEDRIGTIRGDPDPDRTKKGNIS